MGDTERESLNFDKAAYDAPSPSATPCSACKSPLAGRYWKLGPHVLCDGCRGSVAGGFAKAKTGAAFGKAALLGGLVALGCGIGYAIFVGVTHIQLALLTIGIAYVVANVVRRASGGFSGRRFQVLAVGLTYFASTMGYIPGILSALEDGAEKHAAPASSAASQTSPAAPAEGGRTAPIQEHRKPTAGQFAEGIAFLLGVMLAAPFLELTSAPLGALIVAFGLWEAWRRSRAMPLKLEGPFRVAVI